MGKGKREETQQPKISAEDMAKCEPLRRLINIIIYQAVKDRASKLNYEQTENGYNFREKVRGRFHELVPPPQHLTPGIRKRLEQIATNDGLILVDGEEIRLALKKSCSRQHGESYSLQIEYLD